MIVINLYKEIMEVIIMLQGLLHNNYYIYELKIKRNISYYNLLNFKKIYYNLDLNDLNISYLLKKKNDKYHNIKQCKIIIM